MDYSRAIHKQTTIRIFSPKAKLDTKNISGSGGVNIVQRKGSDSLQVREVIKIAKVHRSKKGQRTNLKQTRIKKKIVKFQDLGYFPLALLIGLNLTETKYLWR